MVLYVIVCVGIYVGLQPDVSKGYVRGEQKLILCRLVKGPAGGKLPIGSNDPTMGHYAPAGGSFVVVYQPQQLLPFAVIQF